jgi:glycosyltransferase involved in cell wall biosynthesis
LPNGRDWKALRKFRLLTQLGRPFTDKLICCSRYVQAVTVENLGVRTEETAVVYNGVGIDPFVSAAVAAAPSERRSVPIMGMVGTLEGHKDQATLVRASAELRRRRGPVDVRLIGEGKRRSELEALIKDLEAPVVLLGSRSDIPQQVAALDVFVFSTTEEEGLGIALIEAMAAGVPVVASDVPACREVLDDGALGVLVPPGDPEALAAGIGRVLEEPTPARVRADAARGKVLKDFSAEAMARRYGEILGILPRVFDSKGAA